MANRDRSHRHRKSKKRKKRNNHQGSGSTIVERKSSPFLAPLPELTEEANALFDKAKSGDVAGVEAALGGMDINKTNRDGYTVLHIAVRRQDEAMVELLLKQPGIELYDTILHAVKANNMTITKKLLASHDKLKSAEKIKRLEYVGRPVPMMESSSNDKVRSRYESLMSVQPGIISSILTDGTRKGYSKPKPTRVNIEEQEDKFDSEFHPVITALMLAAQIGSYPLMELFYHRGERLESSQYRHNSSCACDTCLKIPGDKDLTRAHERVHLFNSITQPSYICFLARREKIDPVNYAISKIINLRKICDRDTVFGERFEPFLERLETFMTDLISLCRNTDETRVFLTPKDPEEMERLPYLYPRLWYTVGLRMTKFVAHANTQNVVYRIWATDDWPGWDTYGNFKRCLQFAMRIILFPLCPFIALILLVVPISNTKFIKKLKSPVSRFMTYMVSYLYFLGLVVAQVYWPKQRCNRKDLTSGLSGSDKPEQTDSQCKERGPPNIGTEWVIVAYVISFYACTLKRHTVSWYWRMKWNWFELISQVAFTATFACWAWAYIWTQMPENQLLIDSTERLAWPEDCAEVYADCFLSVAAIFAFGRLLRFMQVNRTIGPIQIGLGKQISDFLGLGCIYFAMLAAFASGLLALYAPYKDFHGFDENGKPRKMDETFTTFWSTMGNLFWYLYGHSDREPGKLPRWTQNTSSGNSTEIVHHTATQYVGEGLYFFYHVIGSMMMFSMLGGYFSQTLYKMWGDMETYWKFARTETYLTFIKDPVFPPPLSWLPSRDGWMDGARFCCLTLGSNDEPDSPNDPKAQASCSFKHCCYITGSKKEKAWKDLNNNYPKLIVELMYRYGSFKEELEAKAHLTNDGIKGIGEEVAELEATLDDIKRKIRTTRRMNRQVAETRREVEEAEAHRSTFHRTNSTDLLLPVSDHESTATPSRPPPSRTTSLPQPSWSKPRLSAEGSAPSQPTPPTTSSTNARQ